ncbi:hypothetical protein ACIP8Z_00265 [Streptomyces sp. NPDC088553]|uniref:hypothetical protein n=1 Tax=Streptomyces sp. NPDC088553 TaxID=3365864 RepID=UPI0038074446
MIATARRVHGPDAAPLRPVPLIDVVRDIAVATETEQDRELIGLWYSFGCETLLGGPAGFPYDVDDLIAMTAVQDLRAVVRRTEALSLPDPPPTRTPWNPPTLRTSSRGGGSCRPCKE